MEQQPNPYNAKKEWHTNDAPDRGSADSLFFEESKPKATRKAAPDAEDTKAESNYKKRYDDLKKHYDDKVAEFKQREQELTAAKVMAQPQYKPPKTKEDLETFKKQYPDLFETVETVAHLRNQNDLEAVDNRLKTIEEREKKLLRREAETALRERHPDFAEIRNSDDFHAWAKEQPEEIQNWVYKNPDNIGLASKAIDFYKMEKGLKSDKVPASKPPKRSAADMVSTKTTAVDSKSPRIWTQKEIASLSIDEYDRYEAEIDQAIVEGRVKG